MSVVVKAKYVILFIILNFLAYSLIQYFITINEYSFLTSLEEETEEEEENGESSNDDE